ncbi:MAG: 6-phosphofructokinase, partial [Syntrophorhabdaceae bacterium]
MARRKRVAILTGGGDVPGLNVAIKAVVVRAEANDIDIIGVRRGWMGLLRVNIDDPEAIQQYIVPLNVEKVRTIDRTGGTILHTPR